MKYFNEIFIIFNKTALCEAVEKGYISIVKLLLTNDNIDINFPFILFYIFLIQFKVLFFNAI